MVRDLVDARNDMLDAVKAAITAAKDQLGLDVVPGAVYSMTDRDKVPDNAAKAPWVRTTIKHAEPGRASISGRRREHNGTIRVSVFWPNNKTNAAHNAQKLAGCVQAALCAHRGFVVFKGVSFDDVEPEGANARQDVVANFTWEQLGAA